jgi:hypothetical protein
MNSRRDLFIIVFAGPEQDSFETVNIRKINRRISIEQDLGIIKERTRLYIYMLLIPVSNRARLSISPSIY